MTHEYLSTFDHDGGVIVQWLELTVRENLIEGEFRANLDLRLELGHDVGPGPHLPWLGVDSHFDLLLGLGFGASRGLFVCLLTCPGAGVSQRMTYSVPSRAAIDRSGRTEQYPSVVSNTSV